MDDKKVERVGFAGEPRHVENVTRGAHVRQQGNADSMMGERTECHGIVHQSHIYAPLVGRVGHQIFVAGLAQQRPFGQVVHHAVVFHLAHRHHIGQPPTSGILPQSDDFPPDVVQLMPISGARPVMTALGQKLRVIFQRVVSGVEKVFAVEFYQCEKACKQ